MHIIEKGVVEMSVYEHACLKRKMEYMSENIKQLERLVDDLEKLLKEKNDR